jgi:hypothetical protein
MAHVRMSVCVNVEIGCMGADKGWCRVTPECSGPTLAINSRISSQARGCGLP